MEKFFYRVQSEDNVLSICKKFSCSMGKLIFVNQLKSEVSAGDILLIEREKNIYMVKPTDTIENLSNRFGFSSEYILEKNNIPYIFCGLIISL